MIKSLRIQNCECHFDTFLEFSPGLNVFVGESDKGKSAIFRAYKLLVQNKPAGDWMRPLYWEGDTIITGEFISPHATVIRTKGKNENSYLLNNEKPVNAGTSVPDEIAKLLDLDDVNLQMQIERAFLMFESSGERGRILNRIAGLDEIETTLDNAKKDISTLKNVYETEKSFLKRKQSELEDFDNLELMQEEVDRAEQTQELLNKSKNRLIKLQKLSSDFVAIDKAITNKERLLACQDILDQANANVQAMSRLQKRVSILKGIAAKYQKIKNELAGETFEGFDEKINKIRITQTSFANLYKRIKKFKKIKADFCIINKEIQETETELEHLQSQIPNVCTECGREL